MTVVRSVKASQVKASAHPKRREADGAASVDRALQALLAFHEGDVGLTLGELVSLLGRRADGLAELWNEWGTVRPILLSAD